MFTQIEFLAIGDTVVDAFIRLKDAHVSCDINKETCQICMKFADKVPFDFDEIIYAVGNSANAAVSASRLGLKAGLITNLGKDENGEKCFKELKKNGVVTKYITAHAKFQTNYHYVLWYEDERTILIKHQEYPYVFPKISKPRWMYLSSLAPNSLPFHQELIAYLKNNPDVRLAFQPGTFQMKLGKDKLADLYTLSQVFFCNVDESKRILGIDENTQSEIKELLQKMHALGPKIVVITDGPKGAYAFDGNESWFMPPYPDPKPPYERTGAGDAFASTFTAAIALGKTVPEALMWAPVNSMSVVQYVGAQKGLLSRLQLEEYIKRAPAEYKPRKI